MKSNSIYLLLTLLWLAACSAPTPQWNYHKTISLDNVAPVGIALEGKSLWLSDPGHDRLVQTDLQGGLLQEVLQLRRPLHIYKSKGKLYIPEYLKDTITVLEGEKRTTLPVNAQLDAPAGIAVKGGTLAVVDFFNHRIILKEGATESAIGQNGKGNGEFHYPTDVAIHDMLLYVSDAYNHRIQVIDFQGQHQFTIGAQDSIQVATGLDVTSSSVYISDFYGNRILVYDLEGKLQQILHENLLQPTDIVVEGESMYIANFGGGNVVVYVKSQY